MVRDFEDQIKTNEAYNCIKPSKSFVTTLIFLSGSLIIVFACVLIIEVLIT